VVTNHGLQSVMSYLEDLLMRRPSESMQS